MQTFAEILGELRKNEGWTLKELSAQLGVSKSYLSLLENTELTPPKIPSMPTLRKMIEVFKLDNRPDRLFDLFRAALNLYPNREFQLPRGWFEGESKRQGNDGVEEVWVIATRIAENFYEDMSQTTVDNINAGRTKYVFFVPFGSQVWIYFLTRLRQEERLDYEKLKTQMICIEAPPIMFFSRISIINPGQSMEGTIGVGFYEQSQFYDLGDKEIDFLMEHLAPVVLTLRKTKNDVLTLPSGQFKRVFPI